MRCSLAIQPTRVNRERTRVLRTGGSSGLLWLAEGTNMQVGTKLKCFMGKRFPS